LFPSHDQGGANDYALNDEFSIPENEPVSKNGQGTVSKNGQGTVSKNGHTKESNKNNIERKDIDAIASFSPPPVNSNGSQTPSKKQPSAHQQLMKSYQDALGYKIPHGAKEGKAAKQILQDGYTIEQVIGCYQKVKSDKFWKSKHLSLVKVYEELGQYCLNGNGHLATMSDDDIAAENERMNAHLPPLGD